ncbi:MAG: prepilin-type N-terminal cleavage/methylation domain-containing protein [Hyphomicrobium denitrificans]|nr:prepilin-type N-terminal cleavage/methylation domain-containing protein [Hyphomicrobium denitrificans]
MSPAGSEPKDCSHEAGFTLFEMLAVLVIVALTAGAISMLYRSPSSEAQLKTASLMAASRLRDIRSGAMISGSDRLAVIDVARKSIEFSNGIAPMTFPRSIDLDVMSADSERVSPTAAGIRFFPNGASTGGTINLRSRDKAYEIRVNWLTGRVSSASIN